MQRARVTAGVMPGNLIAAGVCRLRGRDACISRISRISRISQMYGGVMLYPVGLLAAVWFDSGRKITAV